LDGCELTHQPFFSFKQQLVAMLFLAVPRARVTDAESCARAFSVVFNTEVM